MKRNALFAVLLFGVLAVGTTKSVSFRVVLPAGAASAPGTAPATVAAPGSAPRAEALGGLIAGIRALTATTTPTVTFRLILINIGNASQPTTTLVKTVAADASGTAQTSFEAVPALTCIGEVAIAGGRIGSFTNLQAGQDNPEHFRCGCVLK